MLTGRIPVRGSGVLMLSEFRGNWLATGAMFFVYSQTPERIAGKRTSGRIFAAQASSLDKSVCPSASNNVF
jgi:hypothetical protein